MATKVTVPAPLLDVEVQGSLSNLLLSPTAATALVGGKADATEYSKIVDKKSELLKRVGDFESLLGAGIKEDYDKHADKHQTVSRLLESLASTLTPQPGASNALSARLALVSAAFAASKRERTAADVPFVHVKTVVPPVDSRAAKLKSLVLSTLSSFVDAVSADPEALNDEASTAAAAAELGEVLKPLTAGSLFSDWSPAQLPAETPLSKDTLDGRRAFASTSNKDVEAGAPIAAGLALAARTGLDAADGTFKAPAFKDGWSCKADASNIVWGLALPKPTPVSSLRLFWLNGAPASFTVEVTSDPLPDPLAHATTISAAIPDIHPAAASASASATATGGAGADAAVVTGGGAAAMPVPTETRTHSSGGAAASSAASESTILVMGDAANACSDALRQIIVSSKPDENGQGSVSSVTIPPKYLPTASASGDEKVPCGVTWRMVSKTAAVGEEENGGPKCDGGRIFDDTRASLPHSHVPVGALPDGSATLITGIRVLMREGKAKTNERNAIGLAAVQVMQPDPLHASLSNLSLLRSVQTWAQTAASRLPAASEGEQSALTTALRVAVASGSQELLLRYVCTLLGVSPASSDAPTALPAAATRKVGSHHASSVTEALSALDAAVLPAAKRFEALYNERAGTKKGGTGEVDLRFDPAASGSTSSSYNPLKFSNENKTVRTSGGSNCIAVGNVGFSSGKVAWEFHLDEDNDHDECTCFGAVRKPISSFSYDGESCYMLRAYNGDLYGEGNTGSLTRLGPKSTVRIEYDADAGTLEYFVNGKPHGMAFKGLKGRELFPAVAFYNDNRQVSVVKCEIVVPGTGTSAVATEEDADTGVKAEDVPARVAKALRSGQVAEELHGAKKLGTSLDAAGALLTHLQEVAAAFAPSLVHGSGKGAASASSSSSSSSSSEGATGGAAGGAAAGDKKDKGKKDEAKGKAGKKDEKDKKGKGKGGKEDKDSSSSSEHAQHGKSPTLPPATNQMQALPLEEPFGIQATAGTVLAITSLLRTFLAGSKSTDASVAAKSGELCQVVLRLLRANFERLVAAHVHPSEAGIRVDGEHPTLHGLHETLLSIMDAGQGYPVALQLGAVQTVEAGLQVLYASPQTRAELLQSLIARYRASLSSGAPLSVAHQELLLRCLRYFSSQKGVVALLPPTSSAASSLSESALAMQVRDVSALLQSLFAILTEETRRLLTTGSEGASSGSSSAGAGEALLRDGALLLASYQRHLLALVHDEIDTAAAAVKAGTTPAALESVVAAAAGSDGPASLSLKTASTDLAAKCPQLLDVKLAGSKWVAAASAGNTPAARVLRQYTRLVSAAASQIATAASGVVDAQEAVASSPAGLSSLAAKLRVDADSIVRASVCGRLLPSFLGGVALLASEAWVAADVLPISVWLAGKLHDFAASSLRLRAAVQKKAQQALLTATAADASSSSKPSFLHKLVTLQSLLTDDGSLAAPAPPLQLGTSIEAGTAKVAAAPTHNGTGTANDWTLYRGSLGLASEKCPVALWIDARQADPEDKSWDPDHHANAHDTDKHRPHHHTAAAAATAASSDAADAAASEAADDEDEAHSGDDKSSVASSKASESEEEDEGFGGLFGDDEEEGSKSSSSDSDSDGSSGGKKKKKGKKGEKDEEKREKMAEKTRLVLGEGVAALPAAAILAWLKRNAHGGAASAAAGAAAGTIEGELQAIGSIVGLSHLRPIVCPVSVAGSMIVGGSANLRFQIALPVHAALAPAAVAAGEAVLTQEPVSYVAAALEAARVAREKAEAAAEAAAKKASKGDKKDKKGKGKGKKGKDDEEEEAADKDADSKTAEGAADSKEADSTATAAAAPSLPAPGSRVFVGATVISLAAVGGCDKDAPLASISARLSTAPKAAAALAAPLIAYAKMGREAGSKADAKKLAATGAVADAADPALQTHDVSEWPSCPGSIVLAQASDSDPMAALRNAAGIFAADKQGIVTGGPAIGAGLNFASAAAVRAARTAAGGYWVTEVQRLLAAAVGRLAATLVRGPQVSYEEEELRPVLRSHLFSSGAGFANGDKATATGLPNTDLTGFNLAAWEAASTAAQAALETALTADLTAAPAPASTPASSSSSGPTLAWSAARSPSGGAPLPLSSEDAFIEEVMAGGHEDKAAPGTQLLAWLAKLTPENALKRRAGVFPEIELPLLLALLKHSGNIPAAQAALAEIKCGNENPSAPPSLVTAWKTHTVHVRAFLRVQRSEYLNKKAAQADEKPAETAEAEASVTVSAANAAALRRLRPVAPKTFEEMVAQIKERAHLLLRINASPAIVGEQATDASSMPAAGPSLLTRKSTTSEVDGLSALQSKWAAMLPSVGVQLSRLASSSSSSDAASGDFPSAAPRAAMLARASSWASTDDDGSEVAGSRATSGGAAVADNSDLAALAEDAATLGTGSPSEVINQAIREYVKAGLNAPAPLITRLLHWREARAQSRAFGFAALCSFLALQPAIGSGLASTIASPIQDALIELRPALRGVTERQLDAEAAAASGPAGGSAGRSSRSSGDDSDSDSSSRSGSDDGSSSSDDEDEAAAETGASGADAGASGASGSSGSGASKETVDIAAVSLRHHYMLGLEGCSKRGLSAVQNAHRRLYTALADTLAESIAARDLSTSSLVLWTWGADVPSRDHGFLQDVGLLPALGKLASTQAIAAEHMDDGAVATGSWFPWRLDALRERLLSGSLSKFDLLSHIAAAPAAAVTRLQIAPGHTADPTTLAAAPSGTEWLSARGIDVASLRDVAASMPVGVALDLYAAFTIAPVAPKPAASASASASASDSKVAETSFESKEEAEAPVTSGGAAASPAPAHHGKHGPTAASMVNKGATPLYLVNEEGDELAASMAAALAAATSGVPISVPDVYFGADAEGGSASGVAGLMKADADRRAAQGERSKRKEMKMPSHHHELRAGGSRYLNYYCDKCGDRMDNYGWALETYVCLRAGECGSYFCEKCFAERPDAEAWESMPVEDISSDFSSSSWNSTDNARGHPFPPQAKRRVYSNTHSVKFEEVPGFMSSGPSRQYFYTVLVHKDGAATDADKDALKFDVKSERCVRVWMGLPKKSLSKLTPARVPWVKGFDKTSMRIKTSSSEFILFRGKRCYYNKSDLSEEQKAKVEARLEKDDDFPTNSVKIGGMDLSSGDENYLVFVEEIRPADMTHLDLFGEEDEAEVAAREAAAKAAKEAAAKAAAAALSVVHALPRVAPPMRPIQLLRRSAWALFRFLMVASLGGTSSAGVAGADGGAAAATAPGSMPTTAPALLPSASMIGRSAADDEASASAKLQALTFSLIRQQLSVAAAALKQAGGATTGIRAESGESGASSAASLRRIEAIEAEGISAMVLKHLIAICDTPAAKRNISSAPYLQVLVTLFAAGSPRVQRLVLRLLRYAATRIDPADLDAAVCKAFPAAYIDEWKAVASGAIAGEPVVALGWLLDVIAAPMLPAVGLPKAAAAGVADDEFAARDNAAAASSAQADSFVASNGAQASVFSTPATRGVLFGEGLVSQAIASEATGLLRTMLRLVGLRRVYTPVLQAAVEDAAHSFTKIAEDLAASKLGARVNPPSIDAVRALATFAVLGGSVEPLRVGARVLVSNLTITHADGLVKAANASAASPSSAPGSTAEMEATVVRFQTGETTALVVYARDLLAAPVPVDVRRLLPIPEVAAPGGILITNEDTLKSLQALVNLSNASTNGIASRVRWAALSVLQSQLRSPAAVATALKAGLLDDLYNIALQPVELPAFVSVAALQARYRALEARAFELRNATVSATASAGGAAAAAGVAVPVAAVAPKAASAAAPAHVVTLDQAATLGEEAGVHAFLAYAALQSYDGDAARARKWLDMHREAYFFPPVKAAKGDDAASEASDSEDSFRAPIGVYVGYLPVTLPANFDPEDEDAAPVDETTIMDADNAAFVRVELSLHVPHSAEELDEMDASDLAHALTCPTAHFATSLVAIPKKRITSAAAVIEAATGEAPEAFEGTAVPAYVAAMIEDVYAEFGTQEPGKGKPVLIKKDLEDEFNYAHSTARGSIVDGSASQVAAVYFERAAAEGRLFFRKSLIPSQITLNEGSTATGSDADMDDSDAELVKLQLTLLPGKTPAGSSATEESGSLSDGAVLEAARSSSSSSSSSGSSSARRSTSRRGRGGGRGRGRGRRRYSSDSDGGSGSGEDGEGEGSSDSLLLDDADLISPSATGVSAPVDEEGGSSSSSPEPEAPKKKKKAAEAHGRDPRARAGLLIDPAFVAEKTAPTAPPAPGTLVAIVASGTVPVQAVTSDMSGAVNGVVAAPSASPVPTGLSHMDVIPVTLLNIDSGIAETRPVLLSQVRAISTVHGVHLDAVTPHKSLVDLQKAALVSMSALTTHAARYALQNLLMVHCRAAADRAAGTAAAKTDAELPEFTLASAGGASRLLSLIRVTAANDASTGIGRNTNAEAKEGTDTGSGSSSTVRESLTSDGADNDEDDKAAAGEPSVTDSSVADEGAAVASGQLSGASLYMATLPSLRFVLKYLLLQEKNAVKHDATGVMSAVFSKATSTKAKEEVALASTSAADAALSNLLVDDCISNFTNSLRKTQVVHAESIHPLPAEGVYTGRIHVAGTTELELNFDPRSSTSTREVLTLFSSPAMTDESKIASYCGPAIDPDEESSSADAPRAGHLPWPTKPFVVPGPTVWWRLTCGSGKDIEELAAIKATVDARKAAAKAAGGKGGDKPKAAKKAKKPAASKASKSASAAKKPIPAPLRSSSVGSTYGAAGRLFGDHDDDEEEEEEEHTSEASETSPAMTPTMSPKIGGSARRGSESDAGSHGLFGDDGEEEDSDLAAAIAASLAESGDAAAASSKSSTASDDEDGESKEEDGASTAASSEDAKSEKSDDDAGSDAGSDDDEEEEPRRRIVRRAGGKSRRSSGSDDDASSVRSGSTGGSGSDSEEDADMYGGAAGLFGDDDWDAPPKAAKKGDSKSEEKEQAALVADLGCGTDSWGFAINASPVTGAWTRESHALSKTTCSLAWACWLLEFLLCQVMPVLARGSLHNQQVFDALVTFLRTRSTELRMRSQVVTLLSQLLIHPHMFASMPNLGSLDGVEEAILEAAKGELSGSSSGGIKFLSPRMQALIELVVARRAAQNAFEIAELAQKGKDGVAEPFPGQGVGVVIKPQAAKAGGTLTPPPAGTRITIATAIDALKEAYSPELARALGGASDLTESWEMMTRDLGVDGSNGWFAFRDITERDGEFGKMIALTWFLAHGEMQGTVRIEPEKPLCGAPEDAHFDMYDLVFMFMTAGGALYDDDVSDEHKDVIRKIERWQRWAQAKALGDDSSDDGHSSGDAGDEPPLPCSRIVKPWIGKSAEALKGTASSKPKASKAVTGGGSSAPAASSAEDKEATLKAKAAEACEAVKALFAGLPADVDFTAEAVVDFWKSIMPTSEAEREWSFKFEGDKKVNASTDEAGLKRVLAFFLTHPEMQRAGKSPNLSAPRGGVPTGSVLTIQEAALLLVNAMMHGAESSLSETLGAGYALHSKYGAWLKWAFHFVDPDASASDDEGDASDRKEPELPDYPLTRVVVAAASSKAAAAAPAPVAVEDLPIAPGTVVDLRVVRPTAESEHFHAVAVNASVNLGRALAKSTATAAHQSLRLQQVGAHGVADDAAKTVAGAAVLIQGFDATVAAHVALLQAVLRGNSADKPLTVVLPASEALERSLQLDDTEAERDTSDAGVAAYAAKIEKAFAGASEALKATDACVVTVSQKTADHLASVLARVDAASVLTTAATATPASTPVASVPEEAAVEGGAAAGATGGAAGGGLAALAGKLGGALGLAGVAAKLANARDKARLRILERGVSEKNMNTASTSTFATLAGSDVSKGGVAGFGSIPMKPVLPESDATTTLIDKLMWVHELSAALHEGARPRDAILCQAWMEAIGQHKHIGTNHPYRPGEALRGEVEFKGATALSVTFNPRCATAPGATLTLTWTASGKETTKTFYGPSIDADEDEKDKEKDKDSKEKKKEKEHAWPAEALEIKASKVSYKFTAPAAGGGAAGSGSAHSDLFGVAFTVSATNLSHSAKSTILAKQLEAVSFASKQLLTQWTPAMDADLVRLANRVVESSGTVSEDASDYDSDDSSRPKKKTSSKWKVQTLPIEMLEIRNDVDALQFPSLADVPAPQLRMRFAMMRQFNKLMKDVLPCFSLSSTRPWSVGYRLRNLSHCIFTEVKRGVLDAALKATEGDGYIETLYLSNFKASESESRGDITPETSSCMFVQAYFHLRKYPSSALRHITDRGQNKVFEVQFRGESGIDAGGVYREGLSRICDDVFSERFNLLIRCPNNIAEAKLNRESFVPNPAHRTPLALSMYEFLGKFMGLSMRTKAALPMQFTSLTWKHMIGAKPGFEDIVQMDTKFADLLTHVRSCDAEMIGGMAHTPITTEDAFAAAFPGLTFAIQGTNGTLVELVPGGKDIPVTLASRMRWAEAAENFRLHEFDTQLAAIRRGFACMVPIRALSLFTWEEVEVLVAGSPDVDLKLLKSKTSYSGYSDSDPVIKMFWKAMGKMTGAERSSYLRFVWGRSRLPGEGTHWTHTISTMGGGDSALPMAHTCFCTIDLPRYTTDEKMLWGLRTAVHYGLGGILNG